MRPGTRGYRLVVVSIVLALVGVALDVALTGALRLIDVLVLGGAALGAVQLMLARGWPVVTAFLLFAAIATGATAVHLGVRTVSYEIQGDPWAGNGVPALVFGLVCAQAVIDLRRRTSRDGRPR